MKFLKNILLIITLMIINVLNARIGGIAPAQRSPISQQQPAPVAPQPIVPPAPAQIPQPVAPVPQQQAPAPKPAPQAPLKTFNDYITSIREQWRPTDVINAQGVFTDKFINFIHSADLRVYFIQTLLEAGRNLYLPLSMNNLDNERMMLATDQGIQKIWISHPNCIYDLQTKLMKQSRLDQEVAKFQNKNPSRVILDEYTNSLLTALSGFWDTMGEDKAILIPQARTQINTTFEKYGLIKPMVQQLVPQAQPAPAPVQIPVQQQVIQKALPISLKIGNTQVTIDQNYVQREPVEVIVNAANEHLQHGGGVAGGISKAAGPQLQQYCDAMQNYPGYTTKCPTGKAVITPAFNLTSRGIKNIIHATGPYGSDLNREKLLADAYSNSLEVAANNKLRKIAFPAISTNIFGYPIDQATPIAFAAVRDYIKAHPTDFDEIWFSVPGDNEFAVYKKWMGELQK